LEAIGQKVSFESGPPELSFYLSSEGDLMNEPKVDIADLLGFQGEAVKKTIAALPQSVAMLGFVGGFATLFNFASKNREDRNVLYKFMDAMRKPLMESILMQARAGCDAICILDSSLNVNVESSDFYMDYIVNFVRDVKAVTDVPIIYYLKRASENQLAILDSVVDCIAVDETIFLHKTFMSVKCGVQGNFLNTNLLLPENECLLELKKYFAKAKIMPIECKSRWINSLSHGVLQTSKIQNIRNFMAFNKEL
jgi:uroporphyrinogen-III decarboxylase